MESKRLCAAALFFALSTVYPLSPGAWAQSPPVAASCNRGWNWNQNSLGQDPCHVASMLQATCRNGSDTNGPQSLNGSYYTPPQEERSDDLKCECDTVTYSLIMACMTCQGGRSYSWIEWAHECNTTHVAQYPFDIPNGTAIPRWAFYNITTLPDQDYNATAAEAIGRDPEATPKQTSGPSKKRKSGATALFVLLIIGFFSFKFISCCIKQKRGGRRKPPRRQETLEHIWEQQTSPNLVPNPTVLTTFPPPAYEAPRPPPTYVDTQRLHGQGSGLQSGTPAFPPPTYDTSNPPTHVDTGTLHGQSCRLNPGTRECNCTR